MVPDSAAAATVTAAVVVIVAAPAAAIVVVAATATAAVTVATTAAAYKQHDQNDNPPATVVSIASTHSKNLLFCRLNLKQTTFCLFHSTSYAKVKKAFLLRQITHKFCGILNLYECRKEFGVCDIQMGLQEKPFLL